MKKYIFIVREFDHESNKSRDVLFFSDIVEAEKTRYTFECEFKQNTYYLVMEELR